MARLFNILVFFVLFSYVPVFSVDKNYVVNIIAENERKFSVDKSYILNIIIGNDKRFSIDKNYIAKLNKSDTSILSLLYEQIKIFRFFTFKFTGDIKEDFSYESVSDSDIDYISAIKTKYLLEKKLKSEFLSLKFSYKENSSFITDNNSYPYKKNISVGLNLNIFKNGILEYLRKKDIVTLDLSMIDIIKLNPLKELIAIVTNLALVEEENRDYIKILQRSYLDRMIGYLDDISKYDKYYQSIANMIKEHINMFKIQQNDKKFKLYRFCIINSDKVNFLLEKKKDFIVSHLETIDMRQLSFLDILAESNLKFMFDYNYRKLSNEQVRFSSFGVDLEIPIVSNVNIYHNIDKLKLVEEKRKILYQFYMYEKEIKDNIDDQYQNYYNFQTHLIILNQIISDIEKELKSAELGLKSLNIYELNSIINRAYNEVQLLNIYYFKILHSYEKVKLLLKVLGIEENFCKVE